MLNIYKRCLTFIFHKSCSKKETWCKNKTDMFNYCFTISIILIISFLYLSRDIHKIDRNVQCSISNSKYTLRG